MDFRLSEEFQSEVKTLQSGSDDTLVLGDLFTPWPRQWGYRGDPYLWGCIAANLGGSWLLEDEEFEEVFKVAFMRISGHDFDTAPDTITLREIDFGGMSGGLVSMSWWKGIGYPLLKDRFDSVSEDMNA